MNTSYKNRMIERLRAEKEKQVSEPWMANVSEKEGGLCMLTFVNKSYGLIL